MINKIQPGANTAQAAVLDADRPTPSINIVENINAAALNESDRPTAPHYTAEAEQVWKLANACVIDPAAEIVPDEYLFDWGNVGFAPRGNLVSLKASAKAGKTFLLTLFVKAFINGDFEGLRCNAGGNCLMMDTEQSENDSRKILRRIGNTDGRVTLLNTRTLTAEQRLQVLSMMADHLQPALIIVDGIADLMPGMDYNNTLIAEQVLTELTKMAKKHNAVIFTAIHTNNKDEFATGWLGRLLKQKCACEMYLTTEKNTTMRKIEFTAIRGKQVPDINTEIRDTADSYGLMHIVSEFDAEQQKKSAAKSKYKQKFKNWGLTAGVYTKEDLRERLRKGYKLNNPTNEEINKSNLTREITNAVDCGALELDNSNNRERYIFDD